MVNDVKGGLFEWRKHLKVHPAADEFPLMSEVELKELAEDIRQNGLRNPIVLLETEIRDENGHLTRIYTHTLLDGRNRLDALARLGRIKPVEKPKKDFHRGQSTSWHHSPMKLVDDDDMPSTGYNDDELFTFASEHNIDPYAACLSLNVHRRHLTPSQKRELIVKLLKRDPEISDRQIGGALKADHKTVAAVRADLGGRGEIPHAANRTDTKGRKQPVGDAANKRAATVREKNALAIQEQADNVIGKLPRSWDTPGPSAKPGDVNEALIAASNGFHREIGDFVRSFELRFQAWLASSVLSDEARESLHNMLMQGANGLMLLAQEVDGRGMPDEEAAA